MQMELWLWWEFLRHGHPSHVCSSPKVCPDLAVFGLLPPGNVHGGVGVVACGRQDAKVDLLWSEEEEKVNKARRNVLVILPFLYALTPFQLFCLFSHLLQFDVIHKCGCKRKR